MGATLPVLSRFFVRSLEVLGGQVGRLYALNTFGAVLGTYAAGFHLIPTLGVRTTLLLAAIANIGIGALAIVFDRHLRQLGREAPGAHAEAVAVTAPEPAGPGFRSRGAAGQAVWLTVVGLGISGAASMMYEVAWTRALSLVIGGSTYAFSTMLVTFLTGLALGSYLYSRVARRLRITPVFFGCLQLGIGLSALFVTPFFDRMPELFLRVFQISAVPRVRENDPVLHQCPGHVRSDTLHGGDVPLRDPDRRHGDEPGGARCRTGLLRQHRRRDRRHHRRRLPADPRLGPSVHTQAGGVHESLPRRGDPARIPRDRMATGRGDRVSLLALGGLYVAPAWDANVMTSGVAIYGRNYFGRLGKAGASGATVATADHLLYYKDGLSATVSVHRQGDCCILRVNGKTDASNAGDMHTQLMSGHLPLLDPSRCQARAGDRHGKRRDGGGGVPPPGGAD